MRDRDDMDALIEKRRCIRCNEKPRVVYAGSFGISDFLFRCGCWREVDGVMEMTPPSLSLPRSDSGRAWTERYAGLVMMELKVRGLQGADIVEQPQSTDIAIAAAPPMTVQEFKNRTELIKAVVGEMKDNVHYGLIPKTKGGRSLWEPGAEYLRAAFRIAWDYVWLLEEEDFEKNKFRYRCRAFATNPDGTIYAAWEAHASSDESRFNGFPVADYPNIVRDRCLKRAFVNLIRNVTGTSGEFKGALDTTDAGSAKVEDMPFDPSEMALEDWMERCPIHGVEWRENRNGFAHTHGAANKTWCNRDRIIAAEVLSRMELVAKSAGQSKAEVNSWIKSNYNGRTRSALNEAEQIEMVEAYTEAMVTLSAGADEEKDATPDPAPEPTHEGEEPPATGPTAQASKRSDDDREREEAMSREMDEQLEGGSNDN